jgi:hypothetical protein
MAYSMFFVNRLYFQKNAHVVHIVVGKVRVLLKNAKSYDLKRVFIYFLEGFFLNFVSEII